MSKFLYSVAKKATFLKWDNFTCNLIFCHSWISMDSIGLLLIFSPFVPYKTEVISFLTVEWHVIFLIMENYSFTNACVNPLWAARIYYQGWRPKLDSLIRSAYLMLIWYISRIVFESLTIFLIPNISIYFFYFILSRTIVLC